MRTQLFTPMALLIGIAAFAAGCGGDESVVGPDTTTTGDAHSDVGS